MYRVLFILLLAACSTVDHSKEFDAVQGIMDHQVECWNKGDIPCFMEGYWNNDSLRFIGSDGLTYGWQPTLDRYLESYPDNATMGQLRFEVLSMEMTGPVHMLVLGKFFLTRESGDVSGTFSLTWEKIDGNWVVILDHTSADR